MKCDTIYRYDPVGNRLMKNDGGQITTCSYNAGNELTLLAPPSGAPTTSTYDANGNLLTENAGGALTTYAWDYENRLIGVSSPSGTETYAYSADGMREEKVNSSGTVYYVRDGENVLIETDANLITQAHYTDFPGVWGGLASERRGGVSSFYGFDQQSNTRILASINGNVTDNYLYKAFGEEMAVSGTTINPLRFGGQVGYWRDEAERLYVRRRVLRVDHGRWMSRDPLGFESGYWNLYRYVGNDPILFVDPSGSMSIIKGVIKFFCCLFGRKCCAKNTDKIKEFIQQNSKDQIKYLAKSHGIGEQYDEVSDKCEKVKLIIETIIDLKNAGQEMNDISFCSELLNLMMSNLENDPSHSSFNYGFNTNNSDLFYFRCMFAYDKSKGLPTPSEAINNFIHLYAGVWGAL